MTGKGVLSPDHRKKLPHGFYVVFKKGVSKQRRNDLKVLVLAHTNVVQCIQEKMKL